MQYILAYKEDLTFNGFYVEGLHKEIPVLSVKVTKELREHLLSLENFKLLEVPQETSLNISHVNLFIKVEVPQEVLPPLEPSVHDRVDILEMENAEMLLSSVQNEIRVNTLEQDMADLMLEIATMRGV